jgi:hypothetical protein
MIKIRYFIMLSIYNKMSYSKEGVDQFLNTNFFNNKTSGVYIEVGALDGITNSPSYYFEKNLGWTGLLIDPHPLMYMKLGIYRSKNIITNNLISNSTAPLKYDYIMLQCPSMSGVYNTMPPSIYNTYYENDNMNYIKGSSILLPVTLSKTVLNTMFTSIDFMVVNTVGHEYEIMQSWDFSVPINIIMIYMYDELSSTNNQCIQYMKNNGYSVSTIQFGQYTVFIRNGSPYTI